jgi:N-acetylglucosamine kinase-like BadF-type ATPase
LGGAHVIAAILAVDGGNSKADVALVAADGTLLGAMRGPTVSHQAVGLEPGLDALEATVGRVLKWAGAEPDRRPAARFGIFTLAGADLPADMRMLRRALIERALVDEVVVLNDTHAALRAGSDRPWGVVVVCGAGINGLGVGPTGRTVRFAGVGEYSGDRGGGGDVGTAALAAAIRGRDGRGPRTSLERRVPAHFGLRRPDDLTLELYLGRLDPDRLRELTPLVFAAAADGDPVATSIVDDLADEVVAWARAIIRRLHLTRRDVPVVLSGGVFRTSFDPFFGRIRAGVGRVAPAARVERLAAPPVLGAALLGLDRLELAPADRRAAEARLRSSLTDERLRTGLDAEALDEG